MSFISFDLAGLTRLSDGGVQSRKTMPGFSRRPPRMRLDSSAVDFEEHPDFLVPLPIPVSHTPASFCLPASVPADHSCGRQSARAAAEADF